MAPGQSLEPLVTFDQQFFVCTSYIHHFERPILGRPPECPSHPSMDAAAFGALLYHPQHACTDSKAWCGARALQWPPCAHVQHTRTHLEGVVTYTVCEYVGLPPFRGGQSGAFCNSKASWASPAVGLEGLTW